MPLAAGTKLDGYEIVSRLGAGGMGEVYRARDPALKREVGIKVLPTFVAGARYAGPETDPNWSPDGRKIVFSTCREAGDDPKSVICSHSIHWWRGRAHHRFERCSPYGYYSVWFGLDPNEATTVAARYRNQRHLFAHDGTVITVRRFDGVSGGHLLNDRRYLLDSANEAELGECGDAIVQSNLFDDLAIVQT